VVVAGLWFFLQRKHSSRLDAFARCLGAKGAKMYGAYWCPHCDQQKELFGASFHYAPYVECGIKGSRTPAQACVDANIKHYPTWVFADGARVEGEHSLEFLGQETGCALP
jgi:phage baseplate assembly protein gpV